MYMYMYIVYMNTGEVYGKQGTSEYLYYHMYTKRHTQCNEKPLK